jgi:murein DD-endopeptidase
MRESTTVLRRTRCPGPRQDRVSWWLRARRHLAYSLLLWCLAPSARPAFAQTPPAAPQPTTYLDLPLDVVARPVPQLVPAENGRRYLVYRLFVTSWLDVDLRFRSVEVLDAATGVVLASYDSTALSDPRRQRSTQWIESDSITPANRTLPAGRTATIAVGISLAGTGPAPAALLHRIAFDPVPTVRLRTDSGSATEALVATSEVLPVERRPPPVLSPPLRGSGWRCNNGLALSNAHASLVVSDSRLRVPQRFGCDFNRVDSAGSILPNPFPDEITNEMFYGYGADVLAVADGVIVSVQDGIPENVPQADGRVIMPVPFTNQTVAGNWLALDLGGGRYAFYAHFIPGSIRVRAGQRVRRGTVLGRLGNSGNSVGPHLHFHVGDTPSLNGTEGQPYVFARYSVLGHGRPNPDEPPSEQRMSVPLDGAVLSFPPP